MRADRPLLCRIPLLPDESLPSYLLRLAAANCYEPYSLLTRICQESLARLGMRDKLHCPVRPETFTLLSTLASTSPGELAHATIHRFSQVLISFTKRKGQIIHLSDGHALQLLDKQSRAGYFPQDNISPFCPHCLREAAYHRLAWLPLDVTACLKHACLLVSHCAECETLIDIPTVVACRCGKCDADLRQVATHSLRDKPFDLFTQRLIQAWWGLASPPAASSAWALPAKPVPVLYEVLGGLVSSLLERWDAQAGSWHPDSDLLEAHGIQTTALKGLLNWPQGFYDFMREHLLSSNPVYPQLEPLFSTCLDGWWQSPEFEFVQEAFDQFMLAHYAELDERIWCDRVDGRESFVWQFPYITKRRAAQLLAIRERNVETLAQKGIIGTYASNAGEQLYMSQDVLGLHARWAQGFTSSEMAQLLGVTPDIITCLADAGLLNTANRRAADGSTERLFHLPTRAELQGRGIENVYNPDVYICESGYRDLAVTIQAFANLGVDTSTLIGMVQAGRLWFSLYGGSDPRFRQIRFRKTDLCQLADDIAIAKGWLTSEDVAASMDVKGYAVTRWIEIGLLKPVAHYERGMYFERPIVEAFVCEHVFTETAVQLLGVETWQLHRWECEGRLEPVYGRRIGRSRRNLYRRADVERLREENCPSTP